MGDVVEFPKSKPSHFTIDQVLRDAASYCERGLLIMGYTIDLEPYYISTQLDEEDILNLITALKKTIKAKKIKTQTITITD